MKIRYKKVYVRLFFSYITILILPIFIGVCIYTYALQTIRNQTETMNQKMLEMVHREVDQNISEIGKISTRIAMDVNVERLSNVKTDFTPEHRYIMYELVNDLKRTYVTEEMVSDIFVYFNDTDQACCLRGSMPGYLFYQLYYQTSEYSFLEFEQYLTELHTGEALFIQRDEGEDLLVFTMPKLNLDMQHRSATVGVAVKASNIMEMTETVKWHPDMQIMILNHRNEVINQAGMSGVELGLDYAQLDEGIWYDTPVAGVRSMISVRQSDKIDWKYVTVVPMEVLEKSAGAVQRVALAGLFVCMGAGLLISYGMTHRNYNPLKSILQLFNRQGEGKITDGENEYQWLERQAERFFQEHQTVKQNLSNSQKTLRNYALFQLLEYPKLSLEKREEYLKKYNLKLNFPYYQVVLFVIVSGDSGESDELEKRNELRRFIIRNVFGELVSEYFQCEIVENGDHVAAIINTKDMEECSRKMLQELIGELQKLTLRKFDFTTVALIGDVHETMAGIHDSYVQACEAEDYIQLLDEDIIVYDDIRNVQKQYFYPLEMEQKIINAIKTGEQEKTESYISQVFDVNLKKNQISADMCRCLIFDMMGTLIKGADEAGCHSFLDTLDYTTVISAKLPLNVIRNNFIEIVRVVCEEIARKEEENGSDWQFGRRVQEYVQEHYSNPDLNISLMALEFNMTPAYLSTLYKKQTGNGLLDYINTVRVDEAERLIREGCTVVETAERTGFRDSGSLIRVFKRKKGITPGQMKRNL